MEQDNSNMKSVRFKYEISKRLVKNQTVSVSV